MGNIVGRLGSNPLGYNYRGAAVYGSGLDKLEKAVKEGKLVKLNEDETPRDDYEFVARVGSCGYYVRGGKHGGCGCNEAEKEAEREFQKRGQFEFDTECYDSLCSAEGYCGGAESDEIINYTSSKHAEAKDKIVDEVIKALAGIGIDAKGSSREEKIKSILSQIPSGDKIKKDPETHKKLCQALAKSINQAHNKVIITEDATPEIICRQVAEIISSLNSGTYTEFLEVSKDIKHIIHNLKSLKSMHSSIIKEIEAEITSLGNTTDASPLHQKMDAYKTVMAETDRQLAMLNNLVNTTLSPTDEYVRDNLPKVPFAQLINHTSGTNGYDISRTLTGLPISASVANRINAALKQVGATLADYKNKEYATFNREIAEKLLNSNFSTDEEHKFHEAMEVLRQHYDNKHKIEGSFQGGDDDERFPPTDIEKHEKNRKRTKVLMMKTFNDQVAEAFKHFVESLSAISSRVGKDIPLSDQLNGFRDAIKRLSMDMFHKERLHYALVGYYTDAMSRQKKMEIIAKLKMCISYLDSVIEMPAYSQTKSYFMASKKHLEDILGIIDRYNQMVISKFGKGEDDDHHKEDNVPMKYEKVGSGIFDESDSEKYIMSLKFKSTKHINDAVKQFDFNYKAVQIRKNMESGGKELSKYSQKYDEMTANAIKDILEKEGKTYQKLASDLAKSMEVAKDNNKADNVPMTQTQLRKKFIKIKEELDKTISSSSYALFYNRTKADIYDLHNKIDKYINDSLLPPLDTTTLPPPLDTTTLPPPLDTTTLPPPLDTHNDIYEKLDEINERNIKIHIEHPSLNTKLGDINYGMMHNKVNLSNFVKSDFYKDLNNDDKIIILKIMRGSIEKDYYDGVRSLSKEERTNAIRILNKYNDSLKKIGSGYDDNQYMGGAKGYKLQEDDLSEIKEAQEFLTQQWKTKKNFWATVEAVDLYMRIFTNDLVNNPADIKDIKMMLDEVEILDDWYQEETGNLLTNVFDYFQSTADEYVHEKSLKINKDQHYYEMVRLRAANQKRGMCNIPTSPVKVKESRNALKKVFANLGIIKNLFSVFVAIGNKFGGEELRKKVFMSPAQMYNNIIEYLCVGSYAYNEDQHLNEEPRYLEQEEFYKRFNLILRPIDMDDMLAKNTFSFHKEDKYFTYLMKSISAKIFTVLGMYDVMDRPAEYSGLTPIRMIMGGNEIPKVDENAVALYLRLPLLCQFYRDIFEMDETKPDGSNPKRNEGADSVKIAMIPDIDGVFSGLIKLTFKKLTADPRNYTDNEVSEVIRECNYIYQELSKKYPENTVMNIIEELVLEVNRRYGIISKDNMTKYNGFANERWSYNKHNDKYDSSTEMNLEYPLLPGEESDEPRQLSGAEKLLSGTFGMSTYKENPFTISEKHYELIKKFRCRIDSQLLGNADTFDFNKSIKLVKNKLSSEARTDERFRIVASLVRGKDAIRHVDYAKYLMFHETVIVGLNTLSGVHRVLFDIFDYVDSIEPTKHSAPKDLDESTFYEFIKKLISLSTDFQGLITVNIEDDLINVNFGKIKELVEQLFDQVASYIEILRPHIDSKVLDNFINKLTPGSFYWLQEQLMEKIFDTERKHLNTTTNKYEKYFNTEAFINKCNDIYKNATKTTPLNMGNNLADYIYYDGAKNDLGTGAVPKQDNAQDVHANPYDSLLIKTDGTLKTIDLRYLARYNLYTWDDKHRPETNHSIMMRFNEYIKNYILCCYDTGLSKIYVKLLDNFINGQFGMAINNYNNTFPDTIPLKAMGADKSLLKGIGGLLFLDYKYLEQVSLAIKDAGIEKPANSVINLEKVKNDDNLLKQLGDPQGSQVIFASLAHIISNLMSSKTTNGTPYHLIDNPADIPQYMKEKLRANLPMFKNLFNELINECEFIRKLINQKGATNMCEKATAGGANKGTNEKLETASANAEINKTRFTNIMDSITIGCRAFVASCEQTLKDIGDTPVYFELSQNFIKEYKLQHQVDPLMPLSSLLYQMKGDKANFVPVHSIGSDEFKYMYGTRSLLQDFHKIPLLEHAPGISQICDKYNMSVDVRSKCEKSFLDANFKTVAQLQRFLFEYRIIKGTDAELVHANATGKADDALLLLRKYGMIDDEKDTAPKHRKQLSYPLINTLAKVIRLTENPNPNDSINEMVVNLLAEDKTPEKLFIQNIVDLNIVPINIHALMREIPLVNLYNYSYTFDLMMMETLYSYGMEAADKSHKMKIFRSKLCGDEISTGGHNELTINSATDALAKLIIEPYHKFKPEEEFHLAAAFAGVVNDKELGRPKFLSDQLYNKVLLNSLYDSDSAIYENGVKTRYDSRQSTQLENIDRKNIQLYMDFAKDKERFKKVFVEKKYTLSKIANVDSTDADAEFVAIENVINVLRNRVNPDKFIYKDGKLHEFKNSDVPSAPERFQTSLIRNIVLCTNIFRIVRMKLHRDLVYSKDIILSSAPITRQDITEFHGNDEIRERWAK
jgi:hypothetical protein